ncbi:MULTISPECIES: hypothetical protein [Bifidobacterium]|uniref:hypothetical protein n=1 Tax=Bifidobacterium TaxID=1678 RepID=UPI0016435157|nr:MULTISPECIES: hypothetical protein [Bifidobacterium]MBI0136563.1 hypothetical protein [Bifidobacterium sp. W8120]
MADQGEDGNTGLQSVSDPVEGESSDLPAIVPEDGGEPSGGGHHPKWMVPLIVTVVVAVVVVAGLVGWRVFESRRHDAALDSCSRAVKALQGKTGSARMAVYREASGVNKNQVKDAQAVRALARSVKAADGLRPQTVQCEASMSTGALNAAADKAGKESGAYAAVGRDARAVLASRDAKILDDAKAALNAKKGEAAKLLGDSEGKVADNATRDGLQKAIDRAGQVKGAEAKTYQDAVNDLQLAIDQVNASVQAKSQADQLAAQQAASSNNSGRSGYTPSYRPSFGRGGSGGGYAPAHESAAPQSGGSGVNWDQWVHDHQTPSQCRAGEACPIG